MQQVWQAIVAGSTGAIDFAVVKPCAAASQSIAAGSTGNCGRFGRCNQFCGFCFVLFCFVLFLLPFGLPVSAVSQSIAAGSAGN
jgi:hypothetical protein